MITEYERVYQPRADTYTCCERCRNAVDGCAWSRDFQPIPSQRTRSTVNRDRTDGIKILYCPEFIEGDPLDDRECNIDGLIALFSRVCELTALDYAEAIKTKYNAEKEARSRNLSKADKVRLCAAIESADSTIQYCEKFLGRYAAPLKKRTLAEFGNIL